MKSQSYTMPRTGLKVSQWVGDGGGGVGGGGGGWWCRLIFMSNPT